MTTRELHLRVTAHAEALAAGLASRRGRSPRPGPRPAGLPAGPSRRGPIVAGIICPCIGQGGAEAVDYLMLRSTDPARVRWAGVASPSPRGEADAAALARIESIVPVGNGMAAVESLAARCEVLISWAILDYPSAFAMLARKPRLAQLAHFPVEAPFSEAGAAILGPVDRWVGVSELALESMPATIRRPASVIWNAVDDERTVVRRDRAMMHRAWGIPEGALVAGFLGRLAPEKDPAAMARLAGSLPEPWHVAIVGDGRLRAQLDRAAKFRDRLHVVGPDPAAGDVWNAFDVAVIPSRYESFGLSLAEAIKAGKAVVSTRVGLAKLIPGLTFEVPIGAEGPELAGAVLAAHGSPPRPAAIDLLPRLTPARFGREWTDLIVAEGKAGRREAVAARPMDDPRLAMLAETCPAGTGPCGCGTGPPRSCGHPDRPAQVRKSDCLACQARAWWESSEHLPTATHQPPSQDPS